MSELDRRTLLRRGGLAATAVGAAWVTPVITASPAFAGPSCLQTGSFAWSSLGASNTLVPVAPLPFASYAPVGAFPALTITQTPTQSGTPTNGQNPQTGRTSTAQFGGFFSCYRMSMRCNADDEGWDTVFTFSQNVWNLQFTIYDIDQNAYLDQVFITSPATFSFTKPVTGTVTGSGLAGPPDSLRWNGVGDVPADSVNGNVTVTFAGPVTTFTVAFRSGNNSNATQAVGIGDFTFCR